MTRRIVASLLLATSLVLAGPVRQQTPRLELLADALSLLHSRAAGCNTVQSRLTWLSERSPTVALAPSPQQAIFLSEAIIAAEVAKCHGHPLPDDLSAAMGEARAYEALGITQGSEF